MCAGLFRAWRLFQEASARPSSSVLSHMDFEGVNLAHQINICGLSKSKEQRKKMGSFFFCLGFFFRFFFFHN